MKRFHALPALAALALAGCGSGGQNQSSAEALEQAAEQSDPAAAAVLENAAENGLNPQEALQQAGNAQATTVPQAQATPPSVQAQPNRTGQQTPPPKVSTSPEQAPAGNSQ